MKELINEEAFDPEKLFDKENYNTLTIALNADSLFKEKDVDVLIDLLDPQLSREDKENKLKQLKDNKQQKLLIKAVQEAETSEDKAKLLCICWESGLDFKNDFLFFVEQTCDDDYMVSLEAFTVAENIEDVNDEETLTKAILILDNSKTGNKQIIEDLKSNILSKKL
jgi:hypothetical protein